MTLKDVGFQTCITKLEEANKKLKVLIIFKYKYKLIFLLKENITISRLYIFFFISIITPIYLNLILNNI